jgi:hypothetical protein
LLLTYFEIKVVLVVFIAVCCTGDAGSGKLAGVSRLDFFYLYPENWSKKL